MRVNAHRFVVLGAVLLAVICADGQAENGNHALGDGSGSINGKKSICPVPSFSISPTWSFPENGSDAFVLDLACTSVSRDCVLGCGLSFGMSEYKSLYGGQVAVLNAYVQDCMYGVQLGATMFAEDGTGAQVGLFTWCEQADYLAQVGLMNFCNFSLGFMNDNGARIYTTSAPTFQVGLINLSHNGGIQIGILNLGGVSWQIGVLNFGKKQQIGLFNAGPGLKIGVLNYTRPWLTPIIGW